MGYPVRVNMAYLCRKGELLASYANQTHDILAFVPIPHGATLKIKHGIACISKDHSIAIIDVEDYHWYVI